MNQRAQHPGSSASNESTLPTDGDFFERGTAMLDQVLDTLEVHTFEPRVGDPFDTALIHLASDRPAAMTSVTACWPRSSQPGFRTARGKVIVPARVKVNRR
jgi:molecular chaperone GrpE (heat shock protein)